eukprot:GHVN01013513.1.p1 GENE.GHVN01013513.1~~GHVN01013513.1.p1  ORF type:complete len:383 (+),score=52.02 GHVN01013513.1:74-1222(+)
MAGTAAPEVQATTNETMKPVQTTAANVLMISSRKPRGFYERAAKELFASGDTILKVSALGDSIALAVELANMLETKKAAKIIKVETKYQVITRQSKSQSTSPGIQIVLEKDLDFKCSRIIPGYVSFCQKSEETVFTPVYDDQPKDTFASLNSGDTSLEVGGQGINGAFAKVLTEHQQDVSKYAAVHKEVLAKAVQANKELSESDRAVLQEADNIKERHPDLKACYCRVCPSLKSEDGSSGAVFISVFDDAKRPHHSNNYAMITVISPKGADYASGEDFLAAVEGTAVNLMTAFCDFNGMVKRSKSSSPLALKRINVIRVCLFSGGEHRHADVTKTQVAHSIISGLSKGYHYGPAPRLNFAFDGEDVFQQVWAEMTGLPPTES